MNKSRYDELAARGIVLFTMREHDLTFRHILCHGNLKQISLESRLLMNVKKFNLLFFGSDTFSITILKHLLDKQLCPIGVVTGQSSLLDQFSAANKLVRYRWPFQRNDLKISSSNVGLVASFGHLLNVETINLFEYGLFNVHPSLLPMYRGSTPIQAAIMDGLKETGCTLIQIPPVAKFDIGEIVLQEKVPIKEREYALHLRERLARVGAQMSEKLLTDYEGCMDKRVSQGLYGRSYARKLSVSQGLISFRTEDSAQIDRKIRAYTGTIELFTYCLNGLKIRLEELIDPDSTKNYDLDGLTLDLMLQKNVIEKSVDVKPGTMFFHKVRHILCIKCRDNEWVAFNYVTPDSKPRMTALDFFNGYLSKVQMSQMKTDV